MPQGYTPCKHRAMGLKQVARGLVVRDYLAPPVELMLGVEDDQVMGSNGVLIAIISSLY